MMTCLVVVSIVKSFRLMHNLPEMSWLPILYLQYLIHLMVSGCLYFDPTAFALMGAILAAAPSAPRPIAFPGGPTSLPIRQRGDNAVTNTVCPQTAG
jgi:hypothetical protein